MINTNFNSSGILFEIFNHLSPKEIITCCSLACKEWKKTVDNYFQYFFKSRNLTASLFDSNLLLYFSQVGILSSENCLTHIKDSIIQNFPHLDKVEITSKVDLLKKAIDTNDKQSEIDIKSSLYSSVKIGNEDTIQKFFPIKNPIFSKEQCLHQIQSITHAMENQNENNITYNLVFPFNSQLRLCISVLNISVLRNHIDKTGIYMSQFLSNLKTCFISKRVWNKAWTCFALITGNIPEKWEKEVLEAISSEQKKSQESQKPPSKKRRLQ